MSQRVDWKSGFKAEGIIGEICAVSPYHFGDRVSASLHQSHWWRDFQEHVGSLTCDFYTEPFWGLVATRYIQRTKQCYASCCVGDGTFRKRNVVIYLYIYRWQGQEMFKCFPWEHVYVLNNEFSKKKNTPNENSAPPTPKLVVFVCFCGVNITIMTSYKRSVWHYWTWSWKEMSTVCCVWTSKSYL